MATLVGLVQDQGVHGQYVFEVFQDKDAIERQTIVVAQYLGAYGGGLIHKLGPDNVVLDTPSIWEEFKAMSSIQSCC